MIFNQLSNEADKLEGRVRRSHMYEAGVELDELATEYQRRNGGTYSEALRVMRQRQPDLAQRYEEESFSENARAATVPDRRQDGV